MVVGTNPESIAVMDLNSDGTDDLAVANYGSSSVTLLAGNGAGRFSPMGSPIPVSLPLSVSTADFNQDGRADLAVTSDGPGTNDFGKQSILKSVPG